MQERPTGEKKKKKENRDTEESSGGVFVDDANCPTEFSRISRVTNEWQIISFLNHGFLVITSLKGISRVYVSWWRETKKEDGISGKFCLKSWTDTILIG